MTSTHEGRSAQLNPPDWQEKILWSRFMHREFGPPMRRKGSDPIRGSLKEQIAFYTKDGRRLKYEVYRIGLSDYGVVVVTGLNFGPSIIVSEQKIVKRPIGHSYTYETGTRWFIWDPTLPDEYEEKASVVLKYTDADSVGEYLPHDRPSPERRYHTPGRLSKIAPQLERLRSSQKDCQMSNTNTDSLVRLPKRSLPLDVEEIDARRFGQNMRHLRGNDGSDAEDQTYKMSATPSKDIDPQAEGPRQLASISSSPHAAATTEHRQDFGKQDVDVTIFRPPKRSRISASRPPNIDNRTTIAFSSNRVRRLVVCNTADNFFRQVFPASVIRSKSLSNVCVRSSNDTSFPEQIMVPGDQVDFEELISAIRGSQIWDSPTGEDGAELMLEVSAVYYLDD